MLGLGLAPKLGLVGIWLRLVFPFENLYSPHNSDSSSDKIDTKYTTNIIKINLIRT